MTLRRQSMHYPEFWKPSEPAAPPVYQNLRGYQDNSTISFRRLGAPYNQTYIHKPDSCLKRRIARTQSERRPPKEFRAYSFRRPVEHGVMYLNVDGFQQQQQKQQQQQHADLVKESNDRQRWSMSLERNCGGSGIKSFQPSSQYENLPGYNFRQEYRSCSDLSHANEFSRPTVISLSCQNLAKDLEYGPGIVEKLRAKFSRMSDVQKRNENSSFQTQAKKFSSCDDLRTDEENQKNIRVPIAPAQELCKTDALSVGDIAGIQVENDNSNNTTTRRPAARNIYKEEEPSEVVSIVQLRRRFEKNGEQAAKLRFARDPVTLISKYHPEQMTEYKQNWRNQSNSSAQNVSYKPLTSPKPVEITTQTTSNVLKVLNDGKSNGHEASEPEFVRIARRLRRYEPEVVERPQEIIMEKGSSVESLPQSTPVRPPSYAKWSRRQAAMPVLSHNATIIRETCDITSLLPQDPHSARVSRQTIPTILTDSARSTVPLEASPPPEEPKPTYENLQDNTSQIQKSIVNIQNGWNSIDSVFKYENPENIRDKNYWKPSTPTEINTSHKITIPGRKIEDIGSKSSVTSSPTIPNVVSITVKSGTRSYSSYDKSEEQQEIVKSPTTYTPSYNSTSNYNKTISLSSKYVEERNNKTSHAPPPPTTKLPPTTSTAINGLLSPREKPYGDDVTILKSDASNSSDTAENEQKIKNTQSVTVDESEDSITSDDDSRDGTTGSYDITTYRPHSLIFTRLSSEEEVGGDGNLINRSLISLIPEEDLPDFLVALHEKPVKYIVVEESEKPSTSSILRSNNVKKSEKAPRGTTRIRFDVEKPMAYAYYDETTAMRLLQWDDGTIVEYSYFKQFEDEEEREEVDDPTLAMIEQWESQIAASKICEMSTSSFNAKTTGDSTISPAY